MKLDMPKEWWMRKAQEEGDHCVTAGKIMDQTHIQKINQKFDELTQIHNDIISKEMEDFIEKEWGVKDHDSRVAMIIEAQQARWSGEDSAI